MNLRNNLNKYLTSPWLLALIPAVLFVALIHPSHQRNFLEISEAKKFWGQYAYTDLDQDSISDIVFSAKGTPYYFIMAYNIDYQVYDQWNLKDSINPNISTFFFGNYDQDKYQEIYIFTHNGDSLFLNANEILEKSGLRLDRIFITKIGYLRGEAAALIIPAGFYDENGDGSDELYFFINSHYRLGPRKLYRYDIAHNTLDSSQFTGTIPNYSCSMDADEDGRPEFFGTMSASGNYSTSTSYSDSSTWFMVFDDKLKFKFPPVEFRGFANGLYIQGYRNGNFTGYLLANVVGGTDTTVMSPRIMIWTKDGKLLRYKELKEFSNYPYPLTVLIRDRKTNSDRIYLVADNLQELDSNLNIIRKSSQKFTSYVVTFKNDLNNDGYEELIIYSEEEGKVRIFDENLNKIAEKDIRTTDVWWKFYDYSPKDKKKRTFMTSGKIGYFIDLHKNRFYYFGFLYYPGIYLFFFLFIHLIRKITTRQIEQKERLNQRLVTLQLQSIKGQLDPHFTFNTLNSVASLVYLEDRQAAYDYINKFTQLLRTMLNDAERIYRSLSEELMFVTTYLELEKLRFGEKFNYFIETGPGVTKKEQVPKLVLHTFAENSIKHGILPREGGGLLKIIIEKEIDYLNIIIEDNGVGIAASEGQNNSTGKGLKLTKEFYEILNQINKKPINYTIIDLVDQHGGSAGTRVIVRVPLDEVM